MRLLSLTVRNYRIHRDLTVEFDPSRNLIGGPNETGKSTLAEAIHRALFMRHRAGGELQQSMVSTHGGNPSVTLVFEAGGHKWTLDKEFAGARGSARLRSDDGTNLQGDAAEEKLAALIGNPDGSANRFNDLEARWAHLWVWQGGSGKDPSSQTAGLRDQLVQRLQEQGLAAVMQSDTDERARETIRSIHDGIFTSTGAVKANSRLDRALKDLAAADQALTSSIETKQRLEGASLDLESAVNEVREAESDLPVERQKLAATEIKLEQAKDLKQRQENQQLVANQASKNRETIEAADRRIRTLAGDIARLQHEHAPKETALAALSGRERTASELLDAAETAVRNMATSSRAIRQQHDLASAMVTLMEKQALMDDLKARSEEVRSAQEELSILRETLAKLPAISQEELEGLRNLQGRIEKAQAAVDAIATGVECVAACLSVDLDGTALAPGETRVISETAELKLGEHTLLRIRPGGGATLSDSLRELDALRQNLIKNFDRLGIPTLDEATKAVTKRQVLGQEISAKEAGLKAMGAAGLPTKIEAARSELSAAEADVSRRTEAMPGEQRPVAPVSIDEARTRREQTTEALQEAEGLERTLNFEADANTMPPSDSTETAFLEALRSQGGSSGNQSLRTALGWDDNTYDQVKNSMIARNFIITGKGKGGSVRLAE